jgi:hypothetical protein
MNRDELRNRLTFYQDLGVKQLYKRAIPVRAVAPAATVTAHRKPSLNPRFLRSRRPATRWH